MCQLCLQLKFETDVKQEADRAATGETKFTPRLILNCKMFKKKDGGAGTISKKQDNREVEQ